MSAETLGVVRKAVRSVVEGSPLLKRDPALARKVSEPMVHVSLAAAKLLALENELDQRIDDRTRAAEDRDGVTDQSAAADDAPLSEAAASPGWQPNAVNAAAGTVRSQLRALDFPGFVTSLITGVFQAITTSNLQQLEAVADLLKAIEATTDEFASEQIDDSRANEWLTKRVRGLEGDGSGGLRWKQGTEPPAARDLARMVGASPREARGIDPENLSETVVPMVRRQLARDRQSLLATMVLMGIQRLVVDAGRLTASMELEVAARSEDETRHASRTDARVSTAASANFSMGVWGASAKIQASVGHVRDDRQFTRDEIASRANLRSTVQVAFHTEPVALDRMANASDIRRIQSSALVPEVEKERGQSGAQLSTPSGGRTTEATFDAVPALPEAPTAPTPPGKDKEKEEKESEKPAETAPMDEGGEAKKDQAKSEGKPKSEPKSKPAAKEKGASGKKPEAKASKEPAAASGQH